MSEGKPGPARDVVLSIVYDGFPLNIASRLCSVLYETGDPGLGLALAEASIAASTTSTVSDVAMPRADLARLHLILAMCQEYFDENLDAASNYRLAIRGFRATGEGAEPELERYKIESRARLGSVLSAIGDYVQAESQLRGALAMAAQGQHSVLRLKVCALLADVLSIMGLFEYADPYFDRAINGFRKLETWNDLAMTQIDHSTHIIRRQNKIRPYIPTYLRETTSQQTLQGAFGDTVRSALYLDSLRLTFSSALDRKKWEVYTRKGWSTAFSILGHLSDAEKFSELIETRINATDHRPTGLAVPRDTARSGHLSKQQEGSSLARGAIGLIAGAHLPAQTPPRLLMPPTAKGPARTALQAYGDLSPFPHSAPRTNGIRVW